MAVFGFWLYPVWRRGLCVRAHSPVHPVCLNFCFSPADLRPADRNTKISAGGASAPLLRAARGPGPSAATSRASKIIFLFPVLSRTNQLFLWPAARPNRQTSGHRSDLLPAFRPQTKLFLFRFPRINSLCPARRVCPSVCSASLASSGIRPAAAQLGRPRESARAAAVGDPGQPVPSCSGCAADRICHNPGKLVLVRSICRECVV